MAEGKTYPLEDLPDSYFSGGKHLERTPDDYPDLHELFNLLRAGGGGAAVGHDTVAAGDTTKAVTFATAFPAGSTVKVLCVAEANVNCYPSAISETGFTANISGILGTDVDVAFVAFAV